MWSRPSRPPRSTKAPYSVMFFTVPIRTLPSSRVSRVWVFFSAFSSSRTALRDSTMLPRFLLTLMTRMRSSWPRKAVQVPHRAHVDLAAGQEGSHADVHGEAALDPLDDPARDHAALLIGALHVVPDLHLLGFFLGQDDVAFLVLGLLEQDVDDVPGLDRELARLVAELVDGDDPLRLVADVDDHFALGHLQHDASHNLAFGEVLEADVVHVEESLVLLGVHWAFGGRFDGSRQRQPWLRWGRGLFVLFGLRHVSRRNLQVLSRICSRRDGAPWRLRTSREKREMITT